MYSQRKAAHIFAIIMNPSLRPTVFARLNDG